MRKSILLNEDWTFQIASLPEDHVSLPHSWNGKDGQDGGNDYLRDVGTYTKHFHKPEIKDEDVYLQFDAVNSLCDVILNGKNICHHEGGYSRFIIKITEFLQEENELVVKADNKAYARIYPDAADFTFYGGIYRDVNLLILPKEHFEFQKDSSPALKCFPSVNGNKATLRVEASANTDDEIVIELLDKEGNVVATGKVNEEISVPNVHLWNGLKDPYLYTIKGKLLRDGKLLDEVSSKIGFRFFKVDPKKGFFLNGKSYPLRGVAKHQDRPHVGNAITKADMDEDMKLVKEVGANTLRLSHYQHDQYFYDLCDENGIIVWSEIPYISKYSKEADANAKSQLDELIHQCFNHPSIICWGISNEITMFRKQFGKDCRANHKELNDHAHKEDPSRITGVACFSMMTIFNRVAHITDVASYNLYWGWYVPFTPVTGWILDWWHFFYPHGPIGLSEYGAEGMPNLHSSHPKRFDNTEEYQAQYHEKMLKCFEKRPYLWATHVWNMFDFGSDGRNQGGEKGINHKGLVTFDRKTPKDAFYIYKAYWSEDPFVHICSKRYVNRTDKKAVIKVYSNQNEVTLYNNGKKIATKKGNKIFKFKIVLDAVNDIKATSGNLEDTAKIIRVKEKDKSYILPKGGNNLSWQK